MPTVAQLTPASAAADTDQLPASQAGILRSLTRAQVLAGTQPAINIPGGSLLGRVSPTLGAPEAITLGQGLSLVGGALVAATPAAPALSGLNGSGVLVMPAGATTPRTLADLLADSVLPESFGAIGDGVTDDTAALTAAIATRRPVRLEPRVYMTTGQWTIPVSAVLLGAPGQSILRRMRQVGGGAWINITGPSFRAQGVIFDANSAAVSQESWGVLVDTSCTTTEFRDCSFLNAQGATLGNGLTIQVSDPSVTSHVIDSCEAAGNAAHGVWVQAVDGVRITGCHAHDNVAYGLCLDFNDASFATAAHLGLVAGNHAWANQRGINVGNFNATNLEPPTWGNANPDVMTTLVQGNVCHDNIVYGIAVSGRALAVETNLLSNNGNKGNGGAGILANCAYSRIASNTITGPSQYGIDAGGGQALDIVANHITGAEIGVNPGGSVSVRVANNFLQDNVWAITVYNVETDGSGRNFGQATTNMAITDNWFGISSGAGGGGVLLSDAPQQVLIARNSFVGTGTATIDQCIHAHTDSVVIEHNRWNNSQRLFANPVAINGLQTVQYPDVADTVMVSVAAAGVQSIMTLHQLACVGQIGFIKVTNGGSGYTTATVSIAGGGTGATANAYIANGTIIGITIVNPGSGYGSLGSVATVTIAGDGTGATATASVGLPVLEGRRIAIACNTSTRFSRFGSLPFQDNWTLTDITVPANATIAFTGTFGGWRADMVPLADYVAPPGDGSLVLRTIAADLTLHPAGTGKVRIVSDTDPGGYIVTRGHGSPAGVVSAPPGSDYRNLDGGVGATLWIKRSGTDASGWFAIA
jgi:hypothetical protein